MGIDTLIESHKEFKEKYGQKYASLFKELVEKGQSPKTLFIACSDSRVVPNLITHTKPGDLFIARNIGNFVPPFDPDSQASATPAVLEYAVSILNVENIILCGHTECGACKSLYQELPEDDLETVNIRKWLAFGESAKTQALALAGVENRERLYRATEKFNVIDQLKNLLTYPGIKRRVSERDIFVQGWYYHLDTAELEYFDPVEHRFMPLESALNAERGSNDAPQILGAGEVKA